MLAAVAGLCLAALGAEAPAQPKPADPTLVGWTEDGGFYVYEFNRHITQYQPSYEADVRVAVVLSARTGEERFYLLDPARDQKEPLRHAREYGFRGIAPIEDYARWRKTHRLVPGTSGPALPGRTAVAAVEQTQGTGGWEGSVYRYSIPPWAGEARATLTFVVRDGDRRQEHARDESESTDAPMSGYVIPLHDPVGHRIAWFWLFVTRNRGTDEPVVRLGPSAGPKIELRASKELLPRVIPAVTARLEEAGFYPTSAKPSRDEHRTSEVFAAPGFEEAARQIAALVPGGAAVKPLDWASDFSIVVALGPAAAP
jgi:hypothetical protein